MTQNLKNSAEKLGWHLKTEFIDDLLQEKPNLDVNSLNKICLDFDIRNIAEKFLSDAVSTGKTEFYEGSCVFQLVKLRNVSAPKENESSMTATPMFKITLTDGISHCNCLAINGVNKLTLNTPPGTKILLQGKIKIRSNLLIIGNENCQVLGGNVDYLITKWKTQKELAQHVRAFVSNSSRPPWVPFGTAQKNQVDTSQKVLKNEVNEEDSTSEFSQARQAALAEALKAKSKINKPFTQQKVDKTQIVDQIKADSNLTNLTGQSGSNSNLNLFAPTPDADVSSSTFFGAGIYGRDRGKGTGKGKPRKKNLMDDDENDYREAKDAARPSNITLFDLVKSRIGVQGDDSNEKEEVEEVKPVVYEPPVSYGRGGRGGGRGGRGGRGGGRGGTTSSFTMDTNKFHVPKNTQIFNPNDFAFDLGDTTDVKVVKEQKALIEGFSKMSVEKKREPYRQEQSRSSGGYTQNQNLPVNDYGRNRNEKFEATKRDNYNRPNQVAEVRPKRNEQFDNRNTRNNESGGNRNSNYSNNNNNNNRNGTASYEQQQQPQQGFSNQTTNRNFTNQNQQFKNESRVNSQQSQGNYHQGNNNNNYRQSQGNQNQSEFMDQQRYANNNYQQNGNSGLNNNRPNQRQF